MNITIRKPLGYSQIGRKDQQEDAVWPSFDSVTPANHCIVLCDGVGGSAHGEIASQTSSLVIGEYLTAVLQKNDTVSEDDVQKAVSLAYDELESIDTGDSSGGQPSMATTLTCVCLNDQGIIAAHMGDSRIYLVRPGQGLLYQSSDHSYVNALLKAGELTPEEAKNFKRKNVILKAIQPHAQRRYNAEVHLLTDVRAGDYVFMCCDGVLEQLTGERLVEILSMPCSDDKKIALLEAESTDRTKDNYTAYLIPIDKVEGKSTVVDDDEVATVEVEPPVAAAPAPATSRVTIPTSRPAQAGGNRDVVKKTLVAVAVVAFAVLLFLGGRYTADKIGGSSKDNEKDPVESNEKDVEIDFSAIEKPVSADDTPDACKDNDGAITDEADAVSPKVNPEEKPDAKAEPKTESTVDDKSKKRDASGKERILESFTENKPAATKQKEQSKATPEKAEEPKEEPKGGEPFSEIKESLQNKSTTNDASAR